ncbi:MAG: CopY/TcrY family copper transport repressor [Streptococcaceae bacterium]|nr:CopY/TcrY family copper transport repressor [Streptococcaceae bacterium]
MKVTISDSEMIVMRAIWTLEQATVDQIACQIAAANQWSVATIKTLLGRLVKKEILTTTKSGRKFIYTPTLSECQVVGMLGQELLSKVCAQKHGDVLVTLLASAKLTAADLQKISVAIASKLPACHVACDCLESAAVCQCDEPQQALSRQLLEAI